MFDDTAARSRSPRPSPETRRSPARWRPESPLSSLVGHSGGRHLDLHVVDRPALTSARCGRSRCTWPASSARPEQQYGGGGRSGRPLPVLWQARWRCPRSRAAHRAHRPAADDVAHLQRLVGEWQLLSDLSFADLLLWVPVGDGASSSAWRRYGRPPGRRRTRTTTSGRRQRAPAAAPQLVATGEGRIFREARPGVGRARSRCGGRRSRSAGTRSDRPIGVVGRDTNLVATRSPSKLELAYLTRRTTCAGWSAEGTFPPPGPGRAAHRAAGRGRADPAGRRRAGGLRQPERAVGVPAAGRDRRPARRGAGAADPAR